MKDKTGNRINGFYNNYVKRIIDILLSILLIIILTPLLTILIMVQWISSGRPIFYTPFRGGFKNRKFRIIKFRTMIKNADVVGGGTTSLNDKRITKFGKVMRKTKLDELPQLFNVFLGQMSFVGPRPELIQYVDKYDEKEMDILNVRPGITDYSSIEFISLDELVGEDNADEVYEKVVLKRKNELRLKYVENVSFREDTRIFIVTVLRVFLKIIKKDRGKYGKN